jgi:hypothetical protein
MLALTPVEATIPTTLCVIGTDNDSITSGVFPTFSVPSIRSRSADKSQSVPSSARQSSTARANTRLPNPAIAPPWQESRVGIRKVA